MPLKDLPANSRPREKLLARGVAALSDTELTVPTRRPHEVFAVLFLDSQNRLLAHPE
jgi:DNA repair protein RadC